MQNIKRILMVCLTLCISKNIIAQTNNKYERELIYIENIISKILQNGNIFDNNMDSLNKLKTEKLVQYLKTTKKETYQYLESKGVFQLVESSNKRFAILCWNTYTGGTMDIYESICVYKSKNKSYVKILNNKADGEKYFYLKIDQVKINNKVYYLAQGTGKYSTGDFCSVIENYFIDNDNEIKSDKIFITNTGKLSSIVIYYNFFKVEGFPDEPIPFIRYNSKKDLLEIGVINELGKFTKRYLKYFKKKEGFQYKE